MYVVDKTQCGEYAIGLAAERAYGGPESGSVSCCKYGVLKGNHPSETAAVIVNAAVRGNGEIAGCFVQELFSCALKVMVLK